MTDLWHEEITWQVARLSADDGAILVKGVPYDRRRTFYDEVAADLCVSDCFEFRIFDSYGDGIPGDNYTIIWQGVTTASPSNGFYESGETLQFGQCPLNRTNKATQTVSYN